MILVLPLFFLLASCSFVPNNFQSGQSTDLAERNIRRIAILPSDAPSVADQGKGNEQDPNLLLANSLYSNLLSVPDWQIISDREVREALPKIGQGSDATRARRLGELVYADGVISSRVVRYRQRVGGEFGAQTTASVAFVLELRDTRKGDVVWQARFDETQKPLSENVFSIGDYAKRGIRFVTAEELMLEGVKKAISQLHKSLFPQAT